jgi:hypothetical protein
MIQTILAAFLKNTLGYLLPNIGKSSTSPHDGDEELFIMDKKVKNIAKKCRDLLAETVRKHVTFIIERVFKSEKQGGG